MLKLGYTVVVGALVALSWGLADANAQAGPPICKGVGIATTDFPRGDWVLTCIGLCPPDQFPNVGCGSGPISGGSPLVNFCNCDGVFIFPTDRLFAALSTTNAPRRSVSVVHGACRMHASCF